MPTENRFLPASLLRDVLRATQFLSRLPVHRLDGYDTPPDFTRMVYAFPLAGFIIALPSAALLWVLGQTTLPALAVALLATGCLVITTGALHEDGLADVADGFWGGHDTAKKLAIMRDSSIGTYGTLALILVIGIRIILWAALLDSMTIMTVAMLILVTASLSRAAILWPWLALSPARPTAAPTTKDKKDPSGLSARFGLPDRDIIWPTLICTLPVLFALAMLVGIVPLVGSLAGAMAATAAVIRLASHHIGGHTGDVLGTTQQMSELGLLIALVALI